MNRCNCSDKSDQKYSWVAIIAVPISFLSVIFNIVWSLHTYNQLLPLQSANVVLNESGIEILNNITASDRPENGPGDAIQLSLENIGQATASNIRFRVYDTLQTSSTVIKIFDDHLIHDLQSGDKTRFGYFTIPYAAPNSLDLRQGIGKERVILLIHLEYKNSLNRRRYSKFFLYHYTLGTKGINSIVGADYKELKERLLNSEEVKKNEWLFNSLKQKDWYFVRPLGFEPRTISLKGSCSTRLSYGRN